MDIRINGIIYSLAGEQRKTCEVYVRTEVLR